MPSRKVKRWSIKDDPLARAIAPPKDEPSEERAARLSREAEAKRISDAIDEDIKLAKAELKRKRAVKILLLGQSESGKSTVLKNFQLMYSPQTFRADRPSWRYVILLNLVRSIRLILDALTEAESDRNASIAALITEDHRKLKLKLLPLQQVEETLLRRLASPGETEATSKGELVVRSGSQWMAKLLKSKSGAAKQKAGVIDFEDPDDPGALIHACAADMKLLWADQAVQAVLKHRRLRLSELPGFFLNDLERVTAAQYTPSDEDVLRARMKTLGVTEYKFNLDALSSENGYEWKIYDVGGTRTQRHMWIPFFSDVHSIIFLAPISAFDQALAEDRMVNRLEDSLMLFRAICGNKLLAAVDIILFLNKSDILKSKLENGVQFSKYITSFGDRANDVETVSRFLTTKFTAIYKQQTTRERGFYVHVTSVTDPESTCHILGGVRESILRRNLEHSSLM